MVVEAFSVSELMKDEINALVKSGIYSSKSDVAKDAFRCLLEHKPELRINAAIEMYREEKVSLGRAAEIAGIAFLEFKDVLKERGVKIILNADTEEMERGVRLIKKAKK